MEAPLIKSDVSNGVFVQAEKFLKNKHQIFLALGNEISCPTFGFSACGQGCVQTWFKLSCHTTGVVDQMVSGYTKITAAEAVFLAIGIGTFHMQFHNKIFHAFRGGFVDRVRCLDTPARRLRRA